MKKTEGEEENTLMPAATSLLAHYKTVRFSDINCSAVTPCLLNRSKHLGTYRFNLLLTQLSNSLFGF